MRNKSSHGLDACSGARCIDDGDQGQLCIGKTASACLLNTPGISVQALHAPRTSLAHTCGGPGKHAEYRGKYADGKKKWHPCHTWPLGRMQARSACMLIAYMQGHARLGG